MSCQTSDILDAYHDGELTPAVAERVRLHLRDCPECQAQLAEIQQLSEAIADEADALQVLPIELARMQSGVDASIRSAEARTSLFRVAMGLSAMAASILIIAGAWLADIHAVPASAARESAASPEWERIACTLRAEPRPGIVHEGSPYALRYAVAVDWMLRNHADESSVNASSE